MGHPSRKEETVAATFGRRKVVPRVCVADGKPHIRNFLLTAFEDIGFITGECDGPAKVRPAVLETQPDLFVLGLSAGGIAANEILEILKTMAFAGKVLVIGPSASPMVAAITAIGEANGLAMLPLLPTPFSDNDLRERVSALLPDEAPPNPPIDVSEAIHANWLELWYQPKIEVRTLTLSGAEALVRLRHPTWGIFPPGSFIPDKGDPHFGTLSTFLMTQVVSDWRYFVVEYGNVELSIKLPVSFFQHPTAIDNLARQMPNHPAFQGLIVEINGSDLVRNPSLAKQAARQLQIHNISIAIDNLGAEWPLLMEIDNFPFVEIKVDQHFVTGCADDRLKQSVCRRILDLADSFGARTVAKGIETRADFLAVRALGFDAMQGIYFAKPMERQKFARRVLGRPMKMPE